MGTTIVKVKPKQWVEIRKSGRTYLVGATTIMKLFDESKEKEDGKNDETTDGPRTG